jgi:hypothetical protein
VPSTANSAAFSRKMLTKSTRPYGFAILDRTGFQKFVVTERSAVAGGSPSEASGRRRGIERDIFLEIDPSIFGAMPPSPA